MSQSILFLSQVLLLTCCAKRFVKKLSRLFNIEANFNRVEVFVSQPGFAQWFDPVLKLSLSLSFFFSIDFFLTLWVVSEIELDMHTLRHTPDKSHLFSVLFSFKVLYRACR
jgi:hypothetical protein